MISAKLNLDAMGLTDLERNMVAPIIANQGKNAGGLRASKPDHCSGDSQYIWRMTAFTLSREPKHWCMPVMADFDIECPAGVESRSKYRAERAKRLDEIVDKVCNSIPKDQWHGIRRWKGILG
jgi:hypothetical protein